MVLDCCVKIGIYLDHYTFIITLWLLLFHHPSQSRSNVSLLQILLKSNLIFILLVVRVSSPGAVEGICMMLVPSNRSLCGHSVNTGFFLHRENLGARLSRFPECLRQKKVRDEKNNNKNCVHHVHVSEYVLNRDASI